MADSQQHEPEDDDIDLAPDPAGPTDVGVAANPRRGANGRPPHAERPKEPARIHPEGEARRGKPQQDEGDDDGSDGEGGDQDTESKERPNKDDGRSKKKQQADDDDEDGGASDEKPQNEGGSKGKKGQKKGDDEHQDERPIYKKPVFWIFLALLLVGAVVGFLYYLHARDYESTDDAFVEGHAIQISPQVAARVIKVYIDDNTRVRAGDPLVELDPTDYNVALSQAKGNEAASQGRLEQAKASVENSRTARDQAKAELDSANTQYENTDRDLKRYQALDERARSKQQYDNADTARRNAVAQVDQAKARLANAESQINVSIANVAASQGEYETAVANRKQAEVNLSYCHIVAPVTLGGFARVTTKNVEEGMYATTATPFFSLVEENVWVVANYKETQLQNMRIGQPVTITIDAYPDQDFQGHINSIQAGSGARFSVLPAENATGNYVKVVQRIPVKITFDEGQSKDQNHLLSPGMSVTPYVKIR